MLFRTIPKEEEEALRLRYAGSQAERSSASAKDKKASDKGVPGFLHLRHMRTAGRESVRCLPSISCSPQDTKHGRDVASA